MKSNFALLTVLVIGCLFITSCKEKGTNPDKTDKTSNLKEEFIEIDGVKIGADEIRKKVIQESLTLSNLKIYYTDNANYPIFTVTQERNPNGDTLVPRVYWASAGANYNPDFDLFTVGFYQADGPAPASCQFTSEFSTETEPNGTYELKRIDGKLVSEFTNVSMECSSGGNGTDMKTVSGYLIWEEK